MTTAHESHAAAGTAATTARAEAKAGWWKNPLTLHIAVATGVILVALIINFSFEFNFFWKLLVGGGLVWGGAKMTKTKAGPVSVWGKILRGLGWTMIILALLNSGVRAVAEKAVSWADQTLNGMAGQGTTGKPYSAPVAEQKVYLDVDFRNAPLGKAVTIPMGLSSIAAIRVTMTNINLGYAHYECPEAKELGSLFPVTYEEAGVQGTTIVMIKLTEASRQKLAALNIASVDTTFTQTKGPIYGPSPCKYMQAPAK